MRSAVLAIAVVLALSACATTDVQLLTASSFKIVTRAAGACGPSGARKVANQVAAIEVIKRGGDKFVFVSDQTGKARRYEQSLVVQMLELGDAGYGDALSARSVLGPNWQEIISKGIPNTCS